MILRRLRARNFMRYKEIELTDLPAEGAIAIIGENESGKTTIGEAIAFALFGETVKSRATDISQVISWDAEEVETEIEVDAGARGRLIVRRRADKRGGHDATLHGDADGPPVASGPEAVQDALREAIGLSFDEFRHSFYVAQAELGLFRRPEEGGSDGSRVVREIVGIGALERAAAAERLALADARDRLDEISRAHGVARAVADAHRADPGYGADLEREGRESEDQKAACDRRLPELSSRAARLRDAEAARAEALDAFERLSRAMVLARADGARAQARSELAAIAAGLDAETVRLKRDLGHREKTLGEVRSRVDRLIDYQAKIAELAARLDFYKLEVKRSLDAPDIPDEDIEELEGLALPSTPAAGLKLSQARVGRLQRARSKATRRSVLFFVLAVLCALVGAPSFWHVKPGTAGAAATGPIDSVLEQGVRLFSGGDADRAHAAWLGLTVAGCGFALVFLVLGISRARRAGQRGDQLGLALEAVKRLETEVKDLTAERTLLDGLDLKHPLTFAEAVRPLKNQTLKEQFEKIREQHNDFVSGTEQRDALVAKERADEGKLREDVQELEGRLARVSRLARTIPGEGAATPAAAAAPIPEMLESVEARAKLLLDQLEDADRDRREIERGGGTPGEPVALYRELEAPLTRIFAAAQADAARGRYLAETRLQKLVDAPAEMPAPDLRAALAAERKLLEASIPRAEELRAERDRNDEERRAVDGRRVIAAAKLSGLESRLVEVRGRKRRFGEAEHEARRLDVEVGAVREEAALAELTAEMLEEAAADLGRRVGPMLARHAAAILPRLTGGRYRKVKVQQDLELRVYSPDKGDFVPLVDLSMGAADQLLLSLRLAVGRTLVQAKGLAGERHFLFLDEPMASFDEARARAFLEILRENRDVFPQAFVVAHLRLQGLEGGFVRVVTPTLESRALGGGRKEPLPADDFGDLAGDEIDEEEPEAQSPQKPEARR